MHELGLGDSGTTVLLSPQHHFLTVPCVSLSFPKMQMLLWCFVQALNGITIVKYFTIITVIFFTFPSMLLITIKVQGVTILFFADY